MRLQYGSWNEKSPFPLRMKVEKMSCQGSIRSLVFIEMWAPMWKTPSSCQKKETVALSWSTSGFHCFAMPFRSPGVGAKSERLGERAVCQSSQIIGNLGQGLGLSLVLITPSHKSCLDGLWILGCVPLLCCRVNPEPRQSEEARTLSKKTVCLQGEHNSELGGCGACL